MSTAGSVCTEMSSVIPPLLCSISPELDVGQVEGAFVMGFGNLLSEKLVYDEDTGQLLTHNTWVGPPVLAISSGSRTMYRQNLLVYRST